MLTKYSTRNIENLEACVLIFRCTDGRSVEPSTDLEITFRVIRTPNPEITFGVLAAVVFALLRLADARAPWAVERSKQISAQKRFSFSIFDWSSHNYSIQTSYQL